MTLRWVRTIEKSPHMFASRVDADDDWLLYSGGWQVGRVHRAGGALQGDRIAWSLTGTSTPSAPPDTHGEVATIAAGKDRLATAFRAWTDLAGIRPEGSDAPRWVRTEGHAPYLKPSYDPASDYLLMSGGTAVGRVHRPAEGPRHDPHWMLWMVTAETSAPFHRQGWAIGVEDAQRSLVEAWSAFLAWAELPRPSST